MSSCRRVLFERIAFGGACAITALAIVVAGDAAAQGAVTGVPNAMQGFSQNRDQPIQIEAASLEVRDKKKEAVFSGNVKVVQGDTTMSSKTLVVFYDQSAPPEAPAPAAKQKGAKSAPGAPIQQAQPGPTGSSSIKRLEARGNVVVKQKEQVVTGELAVFDAIESELRNSHPTTGRLNSLEGPLVGTGDGEVHRDIAAVGGRRAASPMCSRHLVVNSLGFQASAPCEHGPRTLRTPR